MARHSAQMVALAALFVGLAVAACSGTVETRSSNPDHPTGGNGGDSGGNGTGNTGNGGKRTGGSAGTSAAGGRIAQGGATSYPAGATGYGGYGYAGSSYGGYGAYGAAGSPTACAPPSCGCSDCLSSCLCYGNDKTFCYNSCFGVGGAGGSIGQAGSPGFPGCDPAACPVQGPFSSSVAATGCCLPDGSCGVQIDQFASVLGVEGGCQRYYQPGAPTSQCPIQGVLVNSPVQTCCRYDNACGLTLDFVNLGCVRSIGGPSSPSGGYRYCSPGGPVGAGGFSGFPDGGVFPSAGGQFSVGGQFNAMGGQVGAGGSRTVDQCVASAQSDCERCVCKSCNTSLDGCFQDPGCPLILQCANQTGCTGADCLQPNTCQSIIEEFGGLGSTSVGLAIPLFGCARSCSTCGFGR